MRDGDKMAAWLREAADELDTAHQLLDDLGVSRSVSDDGVDCTLAARIALLLLTDPAPDPRDSALADR
jgi:hypothetical protein